MSKNFSVGAHKQAGFFLLENPWQGLGASLSLKYKTDLLRVQRSTVNPIKLETWLRPNSAGIPYTLLLRIEAIGFPTFRLLLYIYSAYLGLTGVLGLWLEGLGCRTFCFRFGVEDWPT